ncbi:MAG: hypothetical protein ABIH70_09990 [Chloroflexota bacterium]
MKKLISFGVLIGVMILVLSACQPKEVKIAFVSRSENVTGNYSFIFLMNKDGSNQTDLALWPSFAAPDPRQLWSKDGTKLAYIEYKREESAATWLCVVDADGSNRRRLLDISGYHVDNIAMSPDGNTILMAYTTPRSVEVPHEGHIDIETNYVSNIYAVDVATGTVKPLTDFTGIKADRVVFSPDGRLVAFVGRTDDPYTELNIYIMNADGSNLRKLTDYHVLELLNPAHSLYWSPDSRKILAVPETMMLSDIEYYTDLYLIDVASGETINLTNSPYTDDFYPAWSPDGKKIAFVSGNSTSGYNINTMNADGRNMAKVVDNAGFPSWLPDGKRIIATSSEISLRSKIFIIDADGQNLQGISNSRGSFPLWLSK